MTTFKEYLHEERAGARIPSFDAVDVEKAIELLNEKCSDARWMLDVNRPIWRGERSSLVNAETGFMVSDPSKTIRKSQNTTNFYTLILDNNPLCKDFPKRSRSFIATTDRQVAHDYADGKGEWAMIPFDGVKIGYVGQKDIWYTRISLFGIHSSLEALNDSWSETTLSDSDWNEWIEFDALLKENDSDSMKQLLSGFPLARPYHLRFLDTVYRAYGPKSTGFKCYTTATMPHVENTEVWVGGPVMMISKSMWEAMRHE
jgi:hypothetical protein